MNKFTSVLLVLAASLVAIAGCSDDPAPQSPAPEKTKIYSSALTAAQCSHFAVDGKVQICHKTSSTTKPYSIIRVATEACVNAHANHPNDYVTSTNPADSNYDPTCSGQGCLSVDAPCDPTLPCCDGLTCQNGTCQAPPSTCPCAANPGWGAILASAGTRVEVPLAGTISTLYSTCGSIPGIEGALYDTGPSAADAISALTTGLAALDPNSPTYCEDAGYLLNTFGGTVVTGAFAFKIDAQGVTQGVCSDSEGDTFPLTADQFTACHNDITNASGVVGTPVPDMPFPIAMLAPGLVGLAEIGRRIVRRRKSK